jgi:hypothetical protein
VADEAAADARAYMNEIEPGLVAGLTGAEWAEEAGFGLVDHPAQYKMNNLYADVNAGIDWADAASDGDMMVVPAWNGPTRIVCGEEWAYYTLKVTKGSTPARAGMFVCPSLGRIRVAKGFVGSHPVKGSRDQLVEYNPQEQDWSNLSKTLEQELSSQVVEAEETARGGAAKPTRGVQPLVIPPASSRAMSCHGGAGAAASSSDARADGRLHIAAPEPEGGPAAAGGVDLAATHASSELKKQRRVPHVWVYVRK